jgi:hypothetical protein
MIATWSDTGHVHVWDMSIHAQLLDEVGRALMSMLSGLS